MIIITEPGLAWHRVAIGDSENGGSFTEYRCVQHPRLTRLVQRPNRDAELVESYHIEGISTQYYRTPAEALVAMRANP